MVIAASLASWSCGDTFKEPFREVFSWQFICGRLRTCGFRRRRPPEVSAPELISGLVFHVVAGPGKLAAHVKKLTGKTITDGAMSQQRVLLPLEVFEGMMSAALKPKANPARHPDAFYQGLRLWTSLLDWQRYYPAEALLALYGRRWEQEIFYNELKVDMRSTPWPGRSGHERRPGP